ncbi:MAG TPA: ankyrin repeat domain-containing protein [Tahibacter sp.]|nr:ankyrin repeat domain-containing protein [Tahibacter sp.]
MSWEWLKRLFAGPRTSAAPAPAPAPTAPEPGVRWIEAADTPWGVRVLDVRPVTHTMTSTSADPQCATNAVSFGQDDGTGFIGVEPPARRTIDASLRFPVDRMLADGVLFIPREMEHKWAIFHHRGKLIFVRSWLRRVVAVADIVAHADAVEVTRVHGAFGGDDDEDPDFTRAALDYLVRSHALDETYPAPLPAGVEADPRAAALWCMSMFGNRAAFATPHRFARHDPERPLRTHSLLHIAVARADVAAIEACLAAGIPVDLLAADGLAPLHWALASTGLTIMALLLDRGSPVDVRSAEGATPLMNAVQARSVDRTNFLLDRGADADARDDRGYTALHRAAEMGQRELVRVLLARGATAHVDANGHTPRSFAQARGHDDIVAMLDTAEGSPR